jgi:hypothetical protein
MTSLGRAPTPRMFLGASVASAVVVWVWVMTSPGSGWDAHVYWSASLAHPYASSVAGDPGAYLYSPAFRQVIAPLTTLPWPAFHAIWVGLLLAAIVLLAGPLTILLLVNPIVLFELQAGNIHTLLAVAIVAGFRHPAAWAFVLLTKVTPGVGVLWFAVRREWRNLASVLVATAIVAGVSVLLAPASWVDWVRSLAVNATIPTSDYAGLIFGPLWLRAPLAVGIVTWGALTNRRWTVPVAATVAIPLLALFNLTLLIAVVPLALPRLARFRGNAWLVQGDRRQSVRVPGTDWQAVPGRSGIR